MFDYPVYSMYVSMFTYMYCIVSIRVWCNSFIDKVEKKKLFPSDTQNSLRNLREMVIFYFWIPIYISFNFDEFHWNRSFEKWCNIYHILTSRMTWYFWSEVLCCGYNLKWALLMMDFRLNLIEYPDEKGSFPLCLSPSD